MTESNDMEKVGEDLADELAKEFGNSPMEERKVPRVEESAVYPKRHEPVPRDAQQAVDDHHTKLRYIDRIAELRTECDRNTSSVRHEFTQTKRTFDDELDRIGQELRRHQHEAQALQARYDAIVAESKVLADDANETIQTLHNQAENEVARLQKAIAALAS